MGASFKSHFYLLRLDMGNLQKLGVVPGAQAKSPPRGLNLIDWTDQFSNFSDAPLIANMDLIITVDTSVAHLAGALGRPVWMMLQFVPDWRWLLDGDESAWYPSMRLFRQPTRGDWRGVIKLVAESLSLWIENHRTL